jgi:hypothetical protein
LATLELSVFNISSSIVDDKSSKESSILACPPRCCR